MPPNRSLLDTCHELFLAGLSLSSWLSATISLSDTQWVSAEEQNPYCHANTSGVTSYVLNVGIY